MMFSFRNIQLVLWVINQVNKWKKKMATTRIYIEEVDNLPIYMPPYKPSFIIVHHSLTKDNRIVDTKSITRYHIKVKGWSGNGYHFLLERVGDEYHIEMGRPLNQVGAHCRDGGFNFKSIGICFIGNFDETEPSKRQLKLGYKLIQRLQEILSIQNKNVIGHREAQALAKVPLDQRKTCPGLKFDMVAFRRGLPKTGA